MAFSRQTRTAGLADERQGGERRTIADALESATHALALAGLDEPHRRARRLIAAALKLSAAEVFAHPERELSAAECGYISDALRRMAKHEPLSRIVGRREFWGLEFLLSPDTLDPRPETETLVEAILARLPDRSRPYRFLDLGTGTGCLLLALLSEFPRAEGLGIDIAPGAASTARRNAERLGLAGRARFMAGNWAEAVNGHFDAIVANPPYIPSSAITGLPLEVRHYDPRRALDGGADGLSAYRAIAAELPKLLPPSGLFAAEIGFGQRDAIAAIFAAEGLHVEGFVADLAGIDRCVIIRR